MKKIIYFLTIFFLISCSKQSNNYAKISGLIANNNTKEIIITSKGYKKVIPINLDGTFSDTLKIIKNGYHTFYDNKNKQPLFLNNGNAININYDYNNMSESIVIDGLGSESSDYLIKKSRFIKKENIGNTKLFYKLDKDVFNTRIDFLEKEVNKMLSNNNIDSVLRAKETTNYNLVFNNLKKQYEKQQLFKGSLAVGKPSPKFFNYLNYKGGKTSLDDFKGKYVYLDIWATWCGPCKQQIPYLTKLEKEFHNKNIKFVSISTDGARRNGGSWDKAKDKWRAMVKDKNMTGIQLFADRSFQSDFIKAYNIKGIPRFILIDPKGNIVNSNAPRPSQPQLKELLDGLL